ncbi:MAG: GTP-binding protein, partial [Pseudomonadota bacterium]
HLLQRIQIFNGWQIYGNTIKIIMVMIIAYPVMLGLGMAAEHDLGSRPSHHDGIGDDHDHDDFDSISINLPPIEDLDALQEMLHDMITTHNILRIKGILHRPRMERRQILQAVGPRINLYFDRPWTNDEPRQSQLVIIAAHTCDWAEIRASLEGV